MKKPIPNELMTFAKGALLDDPSRLFNSSLEGNLRRAIDIREGETIDEAALKKLVRAAVALNLARKSTDKVASKRRTGKKSKAVSKSKTEGG
jgi:hypothetical protein